MVATGELEADQSAQGVADEMGARDAGGPRHVGLDVAPGRWADLDRHLAGEFRAPFLRGARHELHRAERHRGEEGHDGDHRDQRAPLDRALRHEGRAAPERALAAARVRHGAFDVGMFKAHWGKATASLVAHLRRADGPDEALALEVAAAAEVETALAHAGLDASAPAVLTTAVADLDDELDAELADPATRRENLAEQIHASRAALEESVRTAMRSAEELAALSRRQRALTRVD